jgi:outer membrane protein TolC
LRQERCAVLERAVRLLIRQYQNGTVDFPRLAKAELDAIKATLDLDGGPEQRRATLKKCEKTAQEILEIVQARRKAGTTSEIDVLEAMAILLEARIEVLRDELQGQLRKDEP